MSLFIDIEFPIDKPEELKVRSDVREDRRAGLILEFLRSQMGAGADDSPPAERDIYHIRMDIDLSEDRFSVRSQEPARRHPDGCGAQAGEMRLRARIPALVKTRSQ